MAMHIVVPLDGSVVAKSALPYAFSLAYRLKASVQLLRIVGESSSDNAEADDSTFVQDYVTRIAHSLTDTAQSRHLPPERVQTLLMRGVLEDDIALLAQVAAADLVVMTPHGRNPHQQRALGRSATRIVQRSGLPILLIPADSTHASHPNPTNAATLHNFESGTIVLALDGTPESERVLDTALYMAQGLGAALHLLRVVPLESDHRYGEGEYADAVNYLKTVKDRADAANVRCTNVVAVGEVAEQLVAYAEGVGAALVAMATHTASDDPHAPLGSITEAVFCTIAVPLLTTYIHRPA